MLILKPIYSLLILKVVKLLREILKSKISLLLAEIHNRTKRHWCQVKPNWERTNISNILKGNIKVRARYETTIILQKLSYMRLI